MFKKDLENTEDPEIKLPRTLNNRKSKRILGKKNYFCFIDCVKAFACMDHNKLWKILQEMRIPKPPYLPPDKPVCKLRSNS